MATEITLKNNQDEVKLCLNQEHTWLFSASYLGFLMNNNQLKSPKSISIFFLFLARYHCKMLNIFNCLMLKTKGLKAQVLKT